MCCCRIRHKYCVWQHWIIYRRHIFFLRIWYNFCAARIFRISLFSLVLWSSSSIRLDECRSISNDPAIFSRVIYFFDRFYWPLNNVCWNTHTTYRDEQYDQNYYDNDLDLYTDRPYVLSSTIRAPIRPALISLPVSNSPATKTTTTAPITSADDFVTTPHHIETEWEIDTTTQPPTPAPPTTIRTTPTTTTTTTTTTTMTTTTPAPTTQTYKTRTETER